MRNASKIRLLNKILAAHSPFGNCLYIDAARGMEHAIESGEAEAEIAEFAKKILRLYDAGAEIEVLDFDGEFFDPLFAIPLVSSAVKRLSGYKSAILVISGLERANIRPGGRNTHRKRAEYAVNMDFIESYVMRYRDSFPNLEIIFL